MKLTSKQEDALKLFNSHRVVNLAGGSRSGKTFITVYKMVAIAMNPKLPPTRQLIARFRFSHAKQSICYDTMPKVLELAGLKGQVTLNKTDWFYEFPNGSTIWIGGLDDKERLEKVLGNEYATIFLNEGSQISYAAFEMIVTRLNPPRGVKGRIIVDYNPPSIQHWGYKMFVKKQFPDGRPIPSEDYVTLQMNPKDNLENISEDYLKTLDSLSAAKRRRFIDGEYSVDSGSLWKRAWIKYASEIPDLWRIVVGVDPTGTVTGDECGIVVAGQCGEDLYVLDDFSFHGTPAEWGAEVVAAYKKWGADVIVAEKNYGGDMVEHTIKTADKTVNVKMVTSSRGKILRAEPVSALYEQGRVSHRTMFNDLEDELCIYEPGVEQSPNRMDALVFAIAELTEAGPSILDVI